MQFRLTYEGPLKAQKSGGGGGRSNEKHAIRKVIHEQLKQLWSCLPVLSARTQHHGVFMPGALGLIPRDSVLDTLGKQFDRCGFQFAPLVSQRFKLSCGLEILFLRRDMPGESLVQSGGDIDNRIKVLLDALRIPKDCSELGGATPNDDEKPFFCLLEDDSLINEISVTTDRLLTPCRDGHEHNVSLVIKVKVWPTDFDWENVDFVV